MPMAAAEPDAAELLKKLRSIDSVYEAGFTLQGSQVVPPPFNAPEAPPTTMRWQFTIAGARRAVLLEAAGPPPARPAPADAEASQVTVRTLNVTVFSDTLSAQRITETHYTMGPDGAKETGQSTLLSLFAPDAGDLALPPKQALWTAGRGFAPFLLEITSVRALPDGLLAVSARGKESPSDVGTWELCIDPAASYLVRQARFTEDRAPRPFCEMSNSGLRTEGPCFYPERATWTINLGRSRATEITFTSAKLEADQDLLARAEKMVAEPYPPNALIMDYRTSPKSTFRTDENGNLVRPTDPPRTSLGDAGPAKLSARTKAFWMLGLSVLLLSVYLLIAYLRARARRGGMT
jgi:hypothetical protein